MLVSLAIVIALPKPHGIRALIASTILRLIFSVGLQPTLFLLGAFNVSLGPRRPCSVDVRLSMPPLWSRDLGFGWQSLCLRCRKAASGRLVKPRAPAGPGWASRSGWWPGDGALGDWPSRESGTKGGAAEV